MKKIFIAMEERIRVGRSVGVPIAASFNEEKINKHLEELNNDSRLKMDFTFYYREEVIFLDSEIKPTDTVNQT